MAERLRTGLERWIEDSADREFIAPRLGQLLGLPTRKCWREKSSSRAGAFLRTARGASSQSSWSWKTCNGPTPAWAVFNLTP